MKEKIVKGIKALKSVQWGKCVGTAILCTMLGVITAPMLTLTGCASLGNNAKDPGKFENLAYQQSNTVVTLEHPIVRVFNVTNTVPVQVPVIVTNTVTLTNVQNQVVVEKRYETNYVEIEKPVITRETNVIAAGTQITVPQLGAPTGGTNAVITGGSLLGNIWGVGGVVGAILSGGVNWWQRSRNRALVASYTGATATSNALGQAAGALTQQVETLLELVKTTPQGAPYAEAATQFLQKHQLATGTFATVAELIKSNVDNEAARESAQDILDLINGLQTKAAPATPAKV